jgi:hypothetical protein
MKTGMGMCMLYRHLTKQNIQWFLGNYKYTPAVIRFDVACIQVYGVRKKVNILMVHTKKIGINWSRYSQDIQRKRKSSHLESGLRCWQTYFKLGLPPLCPKLFHKRPTCIWHMSHAAVGAWQKMLVADYEILPAGISDHRPFFLRLPACGQVWSRTLAIFTTGFQPPGTNHKNKKILILAGGWNSLLLPCSVLWSLLLFQKPASQIDWVTNQIQLHVPQGRGRHKEYAPIFYMPLYMHFLYRGRGIGVGESLKKIYFF